MKETGLDFIRRLDITANIPSDYVVKSDDDTDSRYGYPPPKRPIDIHIKYGLIVLDKPPGPTSHEVVAWIKRMFNIGRAGHGGTLEPNPLWGWVGRP